MFVDVRHDFDGTGMDNQSILLYAATAETDWWSPYYTPYAIRGFYVNGGNYETKGMDGLLHDMCHAIDFYRRGQRERLLKDNYGFLHVSGGKMSEGAIRNELRVITMQSFLGEALFGKVTDNYNVKQTRDNLQGRATKNNRFTDDAYWFAQTEAMLKEHRAVGIEAIKQSWNEMCAYIAKNRVPSLAYHRDQVTLLRAA